MSERVTEQILHLCGCGCLNSRIADLDGLECKENSDSMWYDTERTNQGIVWVMTIPDPFFSFH